MEREWGTNLALSDRRSSKCKDGSVRKQLYSLLMLLLYL